MPTARGRSTAERARKGERFECFAMRVDAHRLEFEMDQDGDPHSEAVRVASDFFGKGATEFANTIVLELEPVASVTELKPVSRLPKANGHGPGPRRGGAA